MKSFDKWIDQEIAEKHLFGIREEVVAQKAWKAALEWIMSDCCPEAWCVHDLEFDIAEELGYAKEYLDSYDRMHGINKYAKKHNNNC